MSHSVPALELHTHVCSTCGQLWWCDGHPWHHNRSAEVCTACWRAEMLELLVEWAALVPAVAGAAPLHLFQ